MRLALLSSRWLPFATVLFGSTFALAADVPARIEFNRDIRPVLSENCFYCHGPDSAHRKAGLRLDTEKGLFAKAKDGTPIVPGKPADSEIWKRIISDDEEELMPPPDSHKKLKPEEKELVKRWIEQGAGWQPHWSLVVPTRPATPAVKDAKWGRNPIDAFILAKLEEKGLKPAPEADRRTLARRLSLDLIGLPPEPAEVEAFVADPSPTAYEAYVDKLIAKPQWGEHRGRYWLDAARYGDTHGIHNDNYREMWPYRDWVIEAYNRNLPFNRFVVEQIAGDLIPDKTLSTQIATGFNRCNITTSEGGSIPAEVQAIYDKDRVDTTSTVFLGLTMGCASCHDHKFDPITARDFYSMAAFFRNTTQPAMDGNRPDTPPIIVVPTGADREKWDSLTTRQTQLSELRKTRKGAAAKGFEAWLKAGSHVKLTSPLGASDEQLVADFGEGKGESASISIAGEAQDLKLTKGTSWSEGPTKADKAIKLAEKTALELPASAGDFDLDQPFSVGGWVLVPPEEGSFAIANKLDPKAKGQSAGWSFTVETRVPSFRLFGKDGKKIEVRGNSSGRTTSGKWTHLFVTYDGSRHPSGVTLYINGKPEFPDFAADSKPLDGSIKNAGPVRLGFDGKRDFKNGALSDFRIYKRELIADEVAVLEKWSAIRKAIAKPDAKLAAGDKASLETLYLVREDQPYRQASLELADVEQGQREIRKRSAITHVMAEKPGMAAKANILFRGQYDQPKDEVIAATPASLHLYPESYPKSRLGLAWWLVDAKNPLTARVTVNRYWQELFGTGLVRTSEDFGIMGENPTHPELLDYLAVDFRENGWDIKRFYKQMVMSSAYRQAANVTPEKLLADPQNRLLSRGPRFRLDAEVLRDFALATSGLLVKKIGGPSVKPYQPAGVWEAVAMFSSNTRFYKQDSGEGLYRRSMYWFWKRSAPPAAMDILNAPTRESCTVRRERTNTPLQALATMNDPQWVEAARYLAQRAILEVKTDAANPIAAFDARVDFVTARLLARKLDPREREICRSALADFQATYNNDAESAKKLIAIGDSKPDAAVQPSDLAAWTMLVSQLMNTDEALNK